VIFGTMLIGNVTPSVAGVYRRIVTDPNSMCLSKSPLILTPFGWIARIGSGFSPALITAESATVLATHRTVWFT